MINKRVDENLLKTIKGYGERKAYKAPFTNQPEGSVNQNAESLKGAIKRTKVVDSLEEAIRNSGLKDGMTISFHHHFRNGDKVLPMVLDKLAEMGFKNLRVEASSFTKAHEGIVKHIKAGVVNRLGSSGLRGDLAKEISMEC